MTGSTLPSPQADPRDTLTAAPPSTGSPSTHDFVRTQTTLVTEEGKSAVNTKLDHNTPAYKALVQKRSYSGDATVFGKKYDASYAPLIGKDGRLTGALFVAVSK